MNDLIIKVSKRSRLIDLDHSTLGIVGENLQEKLIFTFQDEFVDGMARLEYELDGKKYYVLMEKVSQSYILPVQNVLLTKEGNIDLQLVITEDEEGTPVFKSEVFTLYCKKSIEAVGEAPSSYELWIETANRILLEASRVNIDGKKSGNETIITITQRDGNKKSFPILDGQNGQDGQDGNGIVSIEKTSTSGLVDTYTITFSDGTTTTYTVTNGETPDLSNYVQKPEFNESQAEQDTTIEGLQEELDRYKLLENALPHTENETASDYVTLNNTAKAPMEIETTPQTSQETTTGKNKLGLVDGTYTNNGVQAVVSNGTITVTGTATSTSFVSIPLLSNIVLSNEQVTISINNPTTINDSATEFRVYESGSNYMPVPFTSENNKATNTKTGTYVSVYVRTTSGVSYGSGFIIKPQLELGSEATSYEPYTGGIPSPNPDYPQEIHCTTGENQVKVVGKNIFNKVLYQGGINENTGEETSSNYVVRTDFIKVANNENYTLSFEYINVSNYNVLIAEYDSEQSFVKSTRSINRNVSSIVSNNRTSYLRISFYSDARPTPATFDNFFEEVQLENNSTATSYLPYEEKNYPISLGDKEMYNTNNIADGFVYDETEDKFYIERKIGKVTYNGGENWKYRDSYTPADRFVLDHFVDDMELSSHNGYSNYFTVAQSITGTYPYLYLNGDQLVINFSEKGTTTLEDFKNWLSTHNTIVVYQLVNATLEEITDTTLISQLRAIKNALSMQGTTHIISTSSGTNLPFLIKARAVQTIERT